MRRFAALLSCLIFAAGLSAQTTPVRELLGMVPPEMGVVFAVSDLKASWQRYEDSPWAKVLNESELGVKLRQSPELARLKKLEDELKKHLDLDWPKLRDEILGQAVVLAYRPADMGGEQGLFLVRVPNPKLLATLLDRVNELQIKAGEVKSVEPIKHQGVTYHKRNIVKDGETQFYLLDGDLFVFSNKESALQQVVGRKKDASSLVRDHFQKAGADKAAIALWVNPRMLDAEVQKPSNLPWMKSFLAIWKGIDGILLTGDIDKNLEVRLTLVARPANLPEPIRVRFQAPPVPSDLWGKFPSNSILAVAWKASFERTVETWLTPEQRQEMDRGWKQGLGTLVNLDLSKDILPNVGPDVGLAVFPSEKAQNVPQAVFALAAASKPAATPVDQAMIDSLKWVVPLGLMEMNRKLPEPVRLKSLQQGTVKVHFLEQDAFFPAGMQPAFALKDGYFLLATSPEGIARFGAGQGIPVPKTESPLVRFSAQELIPVLKQHRAALVGFLAARTNSGGGAVGASLDHVTSVLGLFSLLELSERQGPDQFSWTLRVHPSQPKK